MAKRKNNIDDIDIVDDFELEDIDDFDPFDVLDDSYEDELAKKSYFVLTSRSLRSRLRFFDGLK